jgi:hypothetical protein
LEENSAFRAILKLEAIFYSKHRKFLADYKVTNPRREELHLRFQQLFILSATAALELDKSRIQQQILLLVSFHEIIYWIMHTAYYRDSAQPEFKINLHRTIAYTSRKSA